MNFYIQISANVIKIQVKSNTVTHMKEKKSNMDILTVANQNRDE